MEPEHRLAKIINAKQSNKCGASEDFNNVWWICGTGRK